MSKRSLREHVQVKKRMCEQCEKPAPGQSFLSKHLKKVYPLELPQSSSCPSLSSISLSLPPGLNNSSTSDVSHKVVQRATLSNHLVTRPEKKEINMATGINQLNFDGDQLGLKRCNWITKNSDKVYVQFHDEQWGVPVYDDNQLFMLLSMANMLMDYNWTEILKRKEVLKEAFVGFDPNAVSKMGEKDIKDIASNKELDLARRRVRCIVNNAKCTVKIVREFGSLSTYLWRYINHQPVINVYRHPESIPLRSPKAEAISRDLLRRGFRLAGPVIVYAFMQAAGLTMDHLMGCFRYTECARVSESPWNIFPNSTAMTEPMAFYNSPLLLTKKLPDSEDGQH